jgi:myosin-5
VDNLINLPYLNEPELLACLQSRFEKNIIYTYTGPVLIAINPFEALKDTKSIQGMELFESFVQRIKSNSSATEQSSDILRHSILISGESGSGKTECAKKILQILVKKETSDLTLSSLKSSSRGSENGEKNMILTKALQASTVFKSFGNATTLHSLNSSRFGQFLNIAFNEENDAIDASVNTYLLENIRVVRQLQGERNFHIFYQLLSGLTENERKELKLYDTVNYRYLSSDGGSAGNRVSTPSTSQKRQSMGADTKTVLTNAPMNYKEDFSTLKTAMREIGFPEEDLRLIFQTVAGILHLGQLQFQSRNKLNDEGSEILPEEGLKEGEETTLDIVSRLCQISGTVLRESLLEKTITSRSETVVLQLSTNQATSARDAIAKTMYVRLFDYLMEELNKYLRGINPNSSTASITSELITKSTIGILDIFGFDSFDENSLEQLCINYANESLQQQFNQQIFKFQLSEYKKEEILYENVLFQDNQDSIDLIVNGIFKCLDDSCRVPDPTDKKFVSNLYKDYSSHNRFTATATQRARNSFAVDHFAGQVVYNSEGFILKNTDELPPKAVELLSDSENKIFSTYGMKIPTLASQSMGGLMSQSMGASTSFYVPNSMASASYHMGGDGGDSGITLKQTKSFTKRNAPSAVAQFKMNLNTLIQQVSYTTPHYIRCINPIDRADVTSTNSPHRASSMSAKNKFVPFNQYHVAEQLRYGGILEAIRVSRSGYPIRYSHKEFIQRFLPLLFLDKNNKAALVRSKDYQTVRSTLKKQSTAKYTIPEMKDACSLFLQLLTKDNRLIPSSQSSSVTKTPTKGAKPASSNVAFTTENVQIGLNKIFLRSQENEFLESLRNSVVQSSLKIVLRFLSMVYRQKKGIIKKRQVQKRNLMAKRIQKRIRIYLAKKRLQELKNNRFYKSVSDEEPVRDRQLPAAESYDHESLASMTSDLTGFFSVSDFLPAHIASMGRKARKARAHKQLGAKINEYKLLDETLLRDITTLLGMKKQFDEFTILRFDIPTAKKLMSDWSQSLSSYKELQTKIKELSKNLDFGYQVIAPEKLIPMGTVGKVISMGRNVAADTRTSSAKTCNKVITKDHKIFKRVYLMIDSLKEVIDLFTIEKNSLEEKQTILNEQLNIKGEKGATLEMNNMMSTLATMVSVLELSKILYQYYVQYINHTIKEYGEGSTYKAAFKNDDVNYILAFASILEAREPYLSAERNDEHLKQKQSYDDIFPMALSVPALFDMYVMPIPEELKNCQVACKYVIASPGHEYVLNCLHQLLSGEVLMYPIKLIKLIGKGTHNYGQVAYYQAALQFEEQTLRSSVPTVDQMNSVDSYSYSITFLTTLLAGVTRSRPENYMIKKVKKGNSTQEKCVFVGFNNDEELSSQLFTVKDSLKPSAISSMLNAPPAEVHALNLIPNFYQPLDRAYVDFLLSNRLIIEEVISSLLREIYLQNKRYESLLSSGFTTKDLLALNVPIELSKLSAIKLYKKMNVIWGSLKENPSLTHYDLFSLIYPSLKERYAPESMRKKLANASHRSSDLWYDFFNNTNTGIFDSRSRSFYKANSKSHHSLYNAADLGMPSLDNMNMVNLAKDKSPIEEISTEFIKCVDFARFLEGKQFTSEELAFELFACGNISDNLSFLTTLWLRNVNEEQLIIMFGGLIENCYRSMHPNITSTGSVMGMGSGGSVMMGAMQAANQPPVPPPSAFSSNSSVIIGGAMPPQSPVSPGRATAVSSKLFLKTIVLLGIETALRKTLKQTEVVQCLEGILNVRIAFGEQDISHFRILSNDDMEMDDEEDEEVEEYQMDGHQFKAKKSGSMGEEDLAGLDEDQMQEITDRLEFLNDLLRQYQEKNNSILSASVMKTKKLLRKFLIHYPREVSKSEGKKKTEQEIHSDIDVVLEVIQVSYEKPESFRETIPSLQLLEFCTLLFNFSGLMYEMALDLSERKIFQYHHHFLQYLLIQPSLEKWETLIQQLIYQKPFLVFVKNSVDQYLPCDRLKQLTIAGSNYNLNNVMVAYRLMTVMFNNTFTLFHIKPWLLNESFSQQLNEVVQMLQSSSKKYLHIPRINPATASVGVSPEEGQDISTATILHTYTGDEELIFSAIRYGFFASAEELEEKKYHYWKALPVTNAMENSPAPASSRLSTSLANLTGGNRNSVAKASDKKEPVNYNLIQCCLTLSKRTDLSPAMQQENRKVISLLLKSISQRIAAKELSKEQLYDLINTNGHGKVILNINKNDKNEFMKELSSFLN